MNDPGLLQLKYLKQKLSISWLDRNPLPSHDVVRQKMHLHGEDVIGLKVGMSLY